MPAQQNPVLTMPPQNPAAAAILILEADLPNVQAFTGRCGADIQIIKADLPDGEEKRQCF